MNSQSHDMETTVESKVWVTATLPEEILRHSGHILYYLDFEWTIVVEMWVALRNMCVGVGDTCLILRMSTDDGESRTVSLPISASAEDYASHFFTPIERPEEVTFGDAATKFVWTSPSRSWVIWGERQLGLAMIAVEEDCLVDLRTLMSQAGVTLRSIDEAAAASRYVFRTRQEANKFERVFRKRYKQRSAF